MWTSVVFKIILNKRHNIDTQVSEHNLVVLFFLGMNLIQVPESEANASEYFQIFKYS